MILARIHMIKPLQAIVRRLRPPRHIGVREAWLHHQHYKGQRIRLDGVVRAFDADTPAIYFTLDDGTVRVGLNAETDLLQPLIGRSVSAIGTLTFKPGVGIFLKVETISDKR